jgi:hypothetical protein
MVTPRFLIAERIALGALMDLAATFLDTLELFYDLYSDEQSTETELASLGATGEQPLRSSAVTLCS